MKKKIDIIASFRNEEKNILEFTKRIKNSFKKFKNIDYKLIFIDDFSNDLSNYLIKKLIKKNRKIKLISFKKNYGGSPSIQTGFDFVGNKSYATVIDCDLQDPPELIAKNFSKIENNETIHFVRKRRDDPFLQIIYTKIAYFFLHFISNGKIIMNSNHFKILPPKVVHKIKKSKEIFPYWNYLFTMYSKKNKLIFYNRQRRIHGKSKFNLFSLNPWITYFSGFFYFKKRFFYTIFTLLILNALVIYIFFSLAYSLFLIGLLALSFCFISINLFAFLFIMYYKSQNKRIYCRYKS